MTINTKLHKQDNFRQGYKLKKICRALGQGRSPYRATFGLRPKKQAEANQVDEFPRKGKSKV